MTSNLLQELDEGLKCLSVNRFNTSELKCNYIKTIDDCLYDGKIYDYTYMAYCVIGDEYRVATLFILFFIILFLFLSMGVVADEFLCPSLLTISKTLRLPDNIVGVTFLAFGNGAPDIFSSLSGVDKDKPELSISAIFGAGIFVTTIVVGSVLMTGEFEVMQRPVIRDIVFYLGSAFMVWFFIWKSKIQVRHAIALISVYVSYIVVVIISRCIYLKTKKGKESQIDSSSTDVSVISDQIENNSNPETCITIEKNSKRADSIEDEDIVLKKFGRTGTFRSSRNRSKEHLTHYYFQNTIHAIERNSFNDKIGEKQKQINGQYFSKSMSIEVLSRALSESKEFIIHISPIDFIEWSEYSWFKKSLEVIKAVPYFPMIFCIPVVDLESPKDNWCRLLSCINLLIAPQVILFFIGLTNKTIGTSFPLWTLVLIVTIILVIIVYLSSTPEEPPFYNRIFAFLGFAVSVLLIKTIADEVINILKTLGIMFSLSDAILGLSILAWGNSVGDLISNISMARNGYPGIGITACFGGPLLNLLLGLGLPFAKQLLNCSEDGIDLTYKPIDTLLCGTLVISLLSSLVLLIFYRFKSHKIHGFYLIILYIVFLTLAILMEYKFL